MKDKILYHGSQNIVETPEIRISRFNKDFYFGFYCTSMQKQARKWATRFGNGYINEYKYTENPNLRIKIFPEMSDEWLDFIAACRAGVPHDYDIVEGPMADDQVYNYVGDFLAGNISREAFWALAKFKNPTHQISFHTARALTTLNFVNVQEVSNHD